MTDGASRLAIYKKQIKKTFADFTNDTHKWVATAISGSKVRHFTSPEGLFKMEALLQCDPHRIFTLCSDRHMVTRSKWDTSKTPVGQVLEHFETLDGHIYRISGDMIQWVREPSLIICCGKGNKNTGRDQIIEVSKWNARSNQSHGNPSN